MEKAIKAEATRLGFSFCGFAPVQQTPHFETYTVWSASKMPAWLAYLASDRVYSAREDPKRISDSALTVMVLGMGYPAKMGRINHFRKIEHPVGNFAAYACQRDYHEVLKEKTNRLMKYIQSIAPNPVSHKIFIDSGPVMEKDFAFLAGLGWIGKNSLFFHPVTGSYCLLACVFLDIPFRTHAPLSNDPCGDCRICIDSCPTHCITENRTLDAGRCISYLTIEHKDEIPDEFREAMGAWVFGCDICQQVCPINQKILSGDAEIHPFEAVILSGTIDLLGGLNLSAEQYQERYQNTPVIRATYDGLLRNIINAAGNSGNPILVESLIQIRDSHLSQIIRSHAAWAIQMIQP